MKLVKLWVLVLGLGWGLVCWGEQGGVSDPGEGYFQRGQFELAVRTWEANYSSLSVGQLLGLATAYQQLGRLREALRVLKETLDDKNIQSSGQAQVLMQLSELYLGMRVVDRELLADVTKLPGVCSKSESLLSEGNRERDHADILIEEAEKCLSDSKTLLDKNIEKSGLQLQANLFNSKGNLLVAKAERKKLEPKYKEALAVYHEGEGLSKEASSGVLAQREKAKQEAEKALKAYDKTLTEAYEKALTEAYGEGERLANYAGDKLLAAQIAVNIVQVLTEQQKCELAETKFHEILPQLMDLPDSHDKVFTLIGLVAQFTPVFTSFWQSSADRKKPRCSLSPIGEKDMRLTALNKAIEVAKSLENKTTMAYAEGYLAQLHIKQTGPYDDAIQLTRQAIFHTQESADSADLLSAPAQLFRWEWQLGKLFDLQQKEKDAISIYRQAAKHLEITKQRCGGVSRAFLKEGEDFYYEYAELLHRQYRLVANNGYLEELTCVIESFKTTQLQNYFYSGCPYDIIDDTRRLRGEELPEDKRNRIRIRTCFDDLDKKSAVTPASTELLSPEIVAGLSYPFVFASSVAKNMTALLGSSYSIMSQFGSIGLSLGLRKQSELKRDCSKVEKFDEEFFSCYPETAVLYLFVLDSELATPNDVVRILDSREGLQLVPFIPYTSGLNSVGETVKEFRGSIENFPTQWNDLTSPKQMDLDSILGGLRSIAGELYQWLIKGADEQIRQYNRGRNENQRINTLIIVPSGILNTLPFAALQDERGEYLIQKYALAIAPAGANLTALKQGADYSKVLLGGFSKAVTVNYQPFPELHVNSEVNTLEHVFGKNNLTALVDAGTEKGVNRFTISSLTEQIKGSYPVIHLTTHGSFRQDDKGSFLLTYDTFINNQTVWKLDEFKKAFETTLVEPLVEVELLTLSACQSATDEKAGLGLTGVAVGVGVRAAVGTLWSVNDLATQQIIEDFYTGITNKDNKKPKALALQAAQQKMIVHNPQGIQYKHPYYWSPFILVGNWL
jgi:CHAT domain-containing protein